ncbi:MAG: DNA cytosine methyltransferase [Rhodoferax sp.]|jgi:DNA (cytosine-5)-methyltransferase 1|uniref:DNA cytosine methyltransferase n=1 Tax=Rhodoferax sp. TaxID=50421 RepID=UPI001B4C758B|nr:DNA cytosine methyltransferase [Rhodoferax sp.]MBP9149213.1 DNA cytosine methyltransferase [Rhodoferax sp.]MBP9736164.1 DNA cytosine methyltransferase [Rhodoferax sp.]
MLTPQFLLSIHSEIVVDLFAGGGGASTGIEQAIGRPVDVAINHDPEAISLHTANHPQTQHFCSDVFEVDPVSATSGRPVGLLWASPDCKHFSKAKGGKPVSKKIRSLAWVVVKWAKAVRPRMIFLENVEEFQTWGPLTEDNMPCPLRKGETFALWKLALQKLGYVVEHRELRACDFGAPTIRKRLFLVARCDGQPIVWPQPTHAQPNKAGKVPKGMKPWRTAAECIDWSIAAPSIFERKKPLADATCRRIAKGIMRYVVQAKNPFIVNGNAAFMTKFNTGSTGFEMNSPMHTVTAGGQQARPGTAITQGLVTAFLAKHYTGVVGSDMADPMATVTSVDHHSLVTANMIHMGHGEGKDGGKRFSHGIRSVTEPINTITASGVVGAVVTSNLIKLRGTNVGSGMDEPLHTISAQGTHHAEVRAFLIKYYGTDQDPALLEPLHTVTTKDRFGLVTVHGEEYAIVDIGLRMLTPRELYLAQGFPADYLIDQGADGQKLTKTAQVRMCGNSVCPPLSRAISQANYSEQVVERKAA